MRHWLVKTEPDAFSLDDLRRESPALWDGVRNYQARNFLREMQLGDVVLIQHSSCKLPAVVGLAVALPIARLKARPELADSHLVRRARLSVMPLSESEAACIASLAGDTLLP
ncbi:EVE domain-containing protein [Cobetia sp. UCD-24C]|uniref:EVE domain-containing protein n=1 Tax=Cobetia sp. UCD-24C TaxID=1716176 RepID=UPI0006CA566E|nr:EVE domain-containing protein [Cobetia sp. UCD-24C]KPM75121.1 hypothetical protein AOG28_16920 [Cobetia sp. UCD-24C]